MGEGMIHMMSFFDDLLSSLPFILFPMQKSRLVCVFLLTLSALWGSVSDRAVIKSDGYDFLFGFLATEDTHVNTGTDAVRSVKEKDHDAYYDDYRN